MNSTTHSSVHSSVTSFIYFYSKFTEEFLLLTAAAIFSLLAVYCYHWVIKKRRLGAARNQVPAGMVKAYLNQLIGEAQFVRTQLFGLIANGENADNAAAFQNLFLKGPAPTSGAASPSSHSSENTAIPQDLMDRLKALESQLTEKESMVVNINVEKTKLLEEVEHLKQNEKAMASAPVGNGDDLLNKIKSLEERLEEYALFEDDLANLKRLQQENSSLKKRLEEMGPGAPAVAAAPAPAAEKEEPKVEAAAPESAPIMKEPAAFALDQSAIDSLLDGVTPSTPMGEPAVSPKAEAALADASPAAEKSADTTSASAARETTIDHSTDRVPETLVASGTSDANAQTTQSIEAAATAETMAGAGPAPSLQAAPAPSGDDFEKLVDSVETSLETAPAMAAAEAPKEESNANKTDEELLKEFENLLNS